MKLKELSNILYIREVSLDLEYTELYFLDHNDNYHRPIEDGPAIIGSNGYLVYWEHGYTVNGPYGWHVRYSDGKTESTKNET
jgi:hypothetical protein